ncbi:2-oxo-4-hydroxy-4-carboxy-5-ureidoimidazoline decarboxylase [Nocardia sp. SYP-A9097]|uniref:2-oxo-4-hydroxy-4-carboxy-5-ureidoimidazoline decarboxylase n=1 Tax=Nocardia sp. SYP-A9097 TaxID=2663237 RepID=UPI00129BF9A0|nr:2-oxo-4-hydroxy-4-carboxy-5-ureidoimidazoline decarboxylase [Nocardia sp. SYP-A9097]MRH87204.1 2-oxo-4-hydroxy-4-carboxy-5-ureidoimidazoline decarboxylase [Nocardia sp. SYP-A9097]
MTENRIGLDEFAALPEAAAVELLLTCCSAPAWAHAVAARRPFASIEELLRAADTELGEISETEIDRGLAGHPRIGDRPDSADSAREQAGMAGADHEIRAAIATGNREYEAKFGHVYLVCATGQSPRQLLTMLTARLGNDPAIERRIVREELAKINRIRLRRLVDSGDAA